MRPRGMTLLEQAIDSGRFASDQHIEVWLDADFQPNDGHLRYSDAAYSAEIAVDRHQPIGELDFVALAGRDVLIVANVESNRMGLLADRIAEFKPSRLWAMVLTDDEEPMRQFVLEGARV